MLVLQSHCQVFRKFVPHWDTAFQAGSSGEEFRHGKSEKADCQRLSAPWVLVR